MLIAFAGPSLSGIRSVPGVEMRGPAGRNDIRTALADGATAIALIDGVFGNAPSVEHKEILLALERGVRVIGAASMGALRAAECQPWGMEGVGPIFEDYASGRRTADADVALLHGPEALGYCPLTLPLVDVDYFADDLQSASPDGNGIPDALRAVARGFHFRDRTWATMLDRMSLSSSERQQLSHAIATSFVSRKRLDAIEAIVRLRPWSERPSAPILQVLP